MNFVLVYIKTEKHKHDYALMLDSMIKNIRLTQESPKIYVLSNADVKTDGVEVRRVKSDDPFLVKLQLLEYMGDLDGFYCLDLDQALFRELPEFDEDIAGDSFGWGMWFPFAGISGDIKDAYGLDVYMMVCTGLLGVKANSRTRELFSLAKKLYTESKVKLTFVKEAEIVDEPYFCIALSQMLYEAEGYIRFKQIDSIVYDWTPRFRYNDDGSLRDDILAWHFQHRKSVNAKQINEWLTAGEKPKKEWITHEY